MRRRDLLAVGVCAALLGRAASAQQPSIPKLGVLLPDAQMERGFRLFRDGLRELGYIEGGNINLETRSAEGEFARLPGLAAELVGLNVAAIAAFSTPAALGAKQATSITPIVMVAADPVGNNLVASLTRPGGNVTGISSVNAGLGGKHVELLTEITPSLSRIAVLLNAEDAFGTSMLASIQLFGKTRQIEVVPHDIRSAAELDTAFATVAREDVGGVIVQGSLPMKHAADLARRKSAAQRGAAQDFCIEWRPDRLFAEWRGDVEGYGSSRRQGVERCQTRRPAGRGADPI